MSPGLSLLTAWEKVVLDLRKQSLFFDQFFYLQWVVRCSNHCTVSFLLSCCMSELQVAPVPLGNSGKNFVLKFLYLWNLRLFLWVWGSHPGIADNYSCGFRKWWRTKYQENTCHTGSQWQSQTSRQKIICYQNPVFCMLVCADFDSNTLNGTLFLHLFIHDVWVFLLMNEMLCFPAMFSIFTEWYL